MIRPFPILLALLVSSGASLPAAPAGDSRPPNIVYILADDLGYGDLGCYGQHVLATPRIDELASEGMRFTSHYAGCAVCEPSRSSLLTGLHTGHVRHRALLRFVNNVGFRPGDVTFAEVMKKAGYATAICGKWHLGDRADTDGPPQYHGFDYTYCVGYPYPEGGIEHWPSHIFVNGERTPIPANAGGHRVRYMDDLYTEAALGFVREHRAHPFILYLAFQNVHAPIDGKLSAGYASRDWPDVEKVFASMSENMDANVGRVLDELQRLGLDRNTVVFFSSDNGAHAEGGHDAAFFHSAGDLRGIKRDLYEGGIRVPLIVRWPGVVAPGSRSDFPCAFWDMLPTFADIGHAPDIPPVDGFSIVPTLRGAPQAPHPWLYWEIMRDTGKKPWDHGRAAQAVRMGPWKGVRLDVDENSSAPLELYQLDSDPAELHDVAALHPDIVARIRAIIDSAHQPSPDFPLYPEEKATAKSAVPATP